MHLKIHLIKLSCIQYKSESGYSNMSIYEFNVNDVNQQNVSLNDYKGKVLLIVNSATKCGLTPQYKGLEELYETYQAKGFEILDFPCNQFMNQAPGTDQELK